MKEPSIPAKQFTYLRIANALAQQIRDGTLRAGDKLPSLRTLCRQYGISQNTALKAYYHLESNMLIETRPQSGYFVRPRYESLSALRPSNPSPLPGQATTDRLISRVYDSLGQDGHLPLSLGTPAVELLPVAKLNKGLLQATRDLQGSGVVYDCVEGNERLRRQVARWAIAMDCRLSFREIITTNGCLHALSLCLMAVTQRGDTIALESPVSFGMLQLAQALGLRVLELPTHPDTGADLDALEAALKKPEVRASLLISNFSNPLGSCMPDDHKRRAAGLAAKYNKPLIENDLNGDVYFGTHRPRSCKSFDTSGMVMWCGSVSKTLAPGYRVGWVAPGKFYEQVRQMKLYQGISGVSVTQETIAGFLETGRYEHHLRKLRHSLQGNLNRFSQAIADYFPEGTSVSRPQGGFVLWVELPGDVDTVKLYDRAVACKTGFAPGRLFTLQNQYGNCMRLNYGLLWNDKLENSLKVLGNLIRYPA